MKKNTKKVFKEIFVISSFKVIIADLLLGLGKRGATIQNQVKMLREIADDLEKEYKNERKL